MKFAAYAFSAALLGLMSVTPASALPSSAASHATAQSQGVQSVNHKPGHNSYGYSQRKIGPNKFNSPNKYYGQKKYYGSKNQFRPGGRYSSAPKGWHRHSKRPSYWQTRGCVVVGPVWFCP